MHKGEREGECGELTTQRDLSYNVVRLVGFAVIHNKEGEGF